MSATLGTRVEGAIAKDLTYVQRLVDSLVRMGQPDIDALHAHLFEQARFDFAAGMRAELERLGLRAGLIRVTDERVLAMLDQRARFAAESIANTYNRDLERQLARIGEAIPTANRQTYMAGLREWEADRIAARTPGISVTEFTTTHNTMQREFVQRNGLEGRGRVAPPEAAEHICEELVGQGWMPLDEAHQLDLPAHVRCIHFIEAEYDAPDTGLLWTGGKTE